MFGWPLVIIVGFFILYYHTRFTKLQSQYRSFTEKSAKTIRVLSVKNKNSERALDLLILRLRLIREAKAGRLTEKRLHHLLRQIDQSLLSHDLKKKNIIPDNHLWKERSRRAWHALEKRGNISSSPPPWEKVAAKAVAQSVPLETVSKTSVSSQETPEFVEFLVEPEKIEPEVKPGARAQAAREIPKENARRHAFQATKASELEKALRRISGWPKILLPFFVQNLGWFIGCFCFLAGSIFLVSYTTGFMKGLTVFFALFSYTLFLIWFGYRLQSKYATAKTGGGALMTMGMLLVPLNISAVVRLIVSSNGNLLYSAVGWLIAVFALIVYYYLVKLIAGLIDRALQGFYPVVFLLLTSIQLAVPLLDIWPIWYVMALFHLLLLGLLSYGFWLYVNDWMRSIFVDQKKIAYFASGILLYSACVSFVHLTWGGGALITPEGYYGPYLMVICGLLFYLESKFKEWVKKSVSLSRFTFVIYGLSIVTLLVATGGITLIITLCLAVAIYGLVVWRYYTLIPLYLVLSALGGLYYVLVLQHFPWSQHFILSVPGLSVLFFLSHYIRRLHDDRFAVYRLTIMLYRVQSLSFFLLAIWSLVNSSPGSVGGSISALLLSGGSWWILQYAPGDLLRTLPTVQYFKQEKTENVNLNNSHWFYVVVVAMTSILVFVPAWGNMLWAPRFASGLLILACLWTWLAIRYRLLGRNALVAKIEVLANSALLSVMAGLVLVCPSTIEIGVRLSLPLFCGVSAAVLLSLSLGLSVSWLFYGFLLLIGTAVGLVKLMYFPGTSVGLMKILLGTALWFGLWWLQCQPDEIDAIRRQRLKLDVALRLLWFFPVSPAEKQSVSVSKKLKLEGGAANV
jgi:hypothetical protein